MMVIYVNDNIELSFSMMMLIHNDDDDHEADGDVESTVSYENI